MRLLFGTPNKDLDDSALNRVGGKTPAAGSLECAVSPNGFRKLGVKLGSNARVVLHADPTGAESEQYRVLRQKLAEQYPQGAALLITSPGQGDGKTLSAVNLAWCLAESNPTLLLEVDLRQPSVARLLGCSPAQGVESAFLGKVEPETTVGVMRQLPLHVALVAETQKDPVRVLKSAGTEKFLVWARDKFRWVVLDAPPVLAAADVLELCSFVDGVLVVVRARTTPRPLIVKSFEVLGARVRGVILNDSSLCSDSYYHQMSSYYRKKGS